MKKYVIIICGVMFIALIAIIASQTIFQNSEDATDMEYRTDMKPIKDRFPDIPDFSECHWKAHTIGKTSFGPTNYWMRGFLCLSEKDFQKILTDYEWSADSVVFPNDVNPSITGEGDFNWHSSKDFQSMILRQSYVGSIYLDITNGILYFDVENN